MAKTLYVTKSDNSRELYDENKVISSILRAHVGRECENRILSSLKSKLYENIPTSEIFELVNRELKNLCPQGSDRYQLKKALMELGPTGYPFERFIAKLLTEFGYKTANSQIMDGLCVKHEVDVVAIKDEREYFIECKYHNQPGNRTDIKTALYVYARGEDLRKKLELLDKKTKFEPWIVTNTKFSTEAIVYGECQKMRLTGWGYPEKGNLEEMVDSKNMYPVTTLSILSFEQKRLLMDNDFIIIQDLLNNNNFQKVLSLNYAQTENVRRACDLILID